MRRVGGYTLIEVMIFLAISGVLFVSAVALIQGQQGRTQFSQSMRDIDSKLQQYVTEVSASYFPSSEKYSCSVDATGRPQLSGSTPKELGTNEDCLFLGKALQFHQDNSTSNSDDTLAVYSILGRRTRDEIVLNLPTQKVLVSSFSEANPTPNPNLVETYTLPFGTKITSAKDNSDNISAMAGFYIDLSQTSADLDANKSASLVSYQYPSNVGMTTPLYPNITDTNVYDCLTLNKLRCSGLDAATSLPSPFTNTSSWTLCFKSASSNQTAKITVGSSANGIQTKIDYVSCT